MKSLILLDIDGAIMPTIFNHGLTNVPKKLKGILSDLTFRHHISLVTGQTLVNAREVKKILEIDCSIYAEFATVFCNGDNKPPKILVDEYELGSFLKKKHSLLPSIPKFGELDEGSHLMIIFIAESNEQLAASDSYLQEIAKNNGSSFHHFANPVDNVVVVTPPSASKGNCFRHLDGKVAIAAGDSSSDIPILEAAEFPIVTFDTGAKPNQKLTKIVEKKGRGYIAENAPPIGLLKGLLKAIEHGY